MSRLYRKSLQLHFGDVQDPTFMLNILKTTKPDQVYNFAAASHVANSFQNPTTTFTVNTQPLWLIFQSILTLELKDKTVVFHASTSEMFGDHAKGVDKFHEGSDFKPMSPYAVSKVSAYHICSYFKRVYGLQVCTALSFNHESPMRNQLFVTQKIVRAAVNLRNCQTKEEFDMHRLYLGNLKAIKDWGHSAEYCDAYHRMVVAEKRRASVSSKSLNPNIEIPTNKKDMTVYVVATDQICTVQDFCTEVFV